MSTTVPPGHVVITSPGLREPMTVRLGEGPVALTDGGSSFEEHRRPRRRSAIQYVGMKLHRLEVPLMFDGWSENPPRTVEVEIQKLEALAVSRKGVQGTPSAVQVWGPVPHKTLEWWIEGVEFGTNVIYQNQRRVRQDVRLSLVQKVDVALAMAENERRPKAKTSYRTVKVPPRMNLRDIAATMLGSSSRWREIRTIKGKPFRTTSVKAGTRIKVPRV